MVSISRVNVVSIAMLLGSVVAGIFGWMATASLIPPAAAILAGLTLMQSPRIAQQWERAVVLRLGAAALRQDTLTASSEGGTKVE